MFGTVDSWLIFKLTGEHVTDATNASRTLLYDIADGRWDPELLELFGVPERALPRVLASAGEFGRTRPEALHGHAVPVAGVAGDQQAALFGQACVDPGMGKNTYGTGSFVLLNAGHTVPAARPGCSRRWPAGSGSSRAYALEASIFVTGAAVQWLRDGLRDHRARRADRAARAQPRRQRRRLLRAGADRPRLAALGSRTRAARSSGSRAARPRAPRARDARGDRLPDGRRGARDGGRLARSRSPSCAPTAARARTAG